MSPLLSGPYNPYLHQSAVMRTVIRHWSSQTVHSYTEHGMAVCVHRSMNTIERWDLKVDTLTVSNQTWLRLWQGHMTLVDPDPQTQTRRVGSIFGVACLVSNSIPSNTAVLCTNLARMGWLGPLDDRHIHVVRFAHGD